ncbi:MAG: alpha-amylase family glycosyl hydrolase [Chloroflexi bacterium]|nr:alpha-amylase family glycosyl hydrolase [Chloroflexota bacterium]
MSIQKSRKLISSVGILVLLITSFASLRPTDVVSASTPNPSTVPIPGSLQSELGCPGDWQPDCAATHLVYDSNDDVWQGTFNVPAGSWEYKAALNDSWDENYGVNAQQNGANIGLALGAATSVKFYYDHKTYWITDNVNSIIATVPGNFQGAIGCSGDWDPSCLRSWLEDPDGDGIYTFTTSSIPAGSYEAKAAINESWDLNYGAGGVQNGPNIPFTVTIGYSPVTFSYDASNHLLTITTTTHAHDNNVEWNGLRHDSRDTLYRTPGGAVPAGTPVTIRFRTFHNDVTSVKMRLYDINAGAQQILNMNLAASDVSCYQTGLENDSCDFWSVTLPNSAPNNLWYRFIITDGTKTVYYADNTPALDGGLGSPSDNVIDNSYALMVYDPAFSTPDWARNAVIYQIFPDRFRNGRANNDPKTGDPRYDQPVLKLPWGTLPEGYCRNYAGATTTTCPWRFDSTQTGLEQPLGRDYMGGDLKGVDQNLDYLKSLGINTIYFNPIFDSGSNHGYDTQDYFKIDPYFGTQKDWDNLVKHADQLGIRIILDGVFNHMSSDSPFFDRYHHYSTVGACESASSPYRDWFTFHDVAQSTGTCVDSQGRSNSATYDGWFGFDSIPVLNKNNPQVESYFVTGSKNVSTYWLGQGASGWRLDVMGDSSFPANYWSDFRQVVKSDDPNAIIIGELWQKDSTLLRFLRGDRADTTMDYRLRDAVIGLLAPQNFDSKGFADSGRPLHPSEFAARIASIREDYPDAAYYGLMNLVGSHDTERILWTLTPGSETTADKEQNAANLADGKQRQKIASLIQFTMPGAPTIFYGDEVGITGDDDPDTRRTYPWADKGGNPDTAMLSHYQTLAAIRGQNNVLTNGDLLMLLADDGAGIVAYGRKTNSQAAIIVINTSAQARVADIPVVNYLPDGINFSSLYGVGNSGSLNVQTASGALHVSLNPESAWILATGTSIDLQPPAAPSGLKVTNEGNNQLSLAWNTVSAAAGYNLYRSPLSGGGWVKVNSDLLTSANHTDTNLRNGQVYYYVVTALDNVGNESMYSNEANGEPHLSIGWANLQWPPSMTHTISASTRTDTVYGQVWIDGTTNQPGATPGLTAQLGFGPAGTNPASDPDWVWVNAQFNVDAGNNDEFMASMLPEAIGNYDYVYRYTTTGGRDWLYADLNGPVPEGGLPANPGKLDVISSGDTTPPATPANLRVVSTSPSNIALAWDAVAGDSSLYGYEVLRGGTSGGPYTQIARVTDASYTDTEVVEGSAYYYVVRALDNSFNRSGNSNEVSATAQARMVNITFNVTVPATTDATGRSVYIAGTLSRLSGGLPDWNPSSVVMTRVDATHWTVTLSGFENTNIEYKYALGDWNYVEKDATCGEITNRTLTLSYGTDGTQIVNNTVPNWRNVAPCGN